MNGSPGATSVQLAASGSFIRAATWAITSPPRSLAVPMTTSGLTRPASSAIACAHAAGAYPANRGSSATCRVRTPYDERIPRAAAPLGPMATASSGARISRARRPAIVRTSSDSVVGAPLMCSIKARTISEQLQALKERDDLCPHVAIFPEDLDGVSDLHRQRQPDFLEPAIPPLGRHPLDRFLLRLQPPGEGRVA